MALSKTKLAAIAAVNNGWIPVARALPETGIQVIVTTAPKRGPSTGPGSTSRDIGMAAGRSPRWWPGKRSTRGWVT